MKRNILILMVMLVALGAQAQNVLTVPEGQLTPGASAGLKYDRIETVRNIPTGVLTAFAVPATVDGYFFGADAERYEIESIVALENGCKEFRVYKMDDLADFVSGKLYLVKAEKGADKLYSYTAGILTPVGAEQRNLECYPVSFPDVTKDKEVNVSDVTALVDIILGKHDREHWDYVAADVMADGKHDVADVTALVNQILNGTNKITIVVK